jgi:hypothetical protein
MLAQKVWKFSIKTIVKIICNRKEKIMNTFLLKQAAVTTGYKFYVDGSGNKNSFTLKSTSPFVILDRLIGNIVGIPFTVDITKSESDEKIILKKKCRFLFENYEVLR